MTCRVSLLERIEGLNLNQNHLRHFSKEPDIPRDPGLNVFHFKKFLRLKSLKHEETHSCLSVELPQYLLANTVEGTSNPEDHLSTINIFVNKKTGSFVVPGFGVTGTFADFELLINTWMTNRNAKRGDDKQPYPTLNHNLLPGLPPHLKARFESMTPVEHLSKEQFRTLLANLRLSKKEFQARNFSQFEARVNEKLCEVLFPIRYVTGTIVGLRQLRLEGNELVETNLPKAVRHGLMPFLHGLHSCLTDTSDICLLVSSILDSMALANYHTRGGHQLPPVVTLADTGCLHPDHLPYLERFHTVFIWLGNDVQSAQNAKVFSSKIGDKKCRLVSSQYPHPRAAISARLDPVEIIGDARSNYHEYLTTFEQLRESVYLEFVQADQMMGVKFMRYEQLNSILGGFRRGELTIFSGRTGSGKTTFLSEYSLDLCMQGVQTLWCSFEVRNTRLLRMMMKQYSLVNLEEELQHFDYVAEKFTQLPLYLTNFHGNQHLAKVQEAMAHAIYVHDISHIIIDNMQFMLGCSPDGGGDRFHVQDNAIQTFRKFATAHNCHLTIVIHPRKEAEELLSTNSVFGGAKATQEADNVLLLQEESSNSKAFFKKKSLLIAKNRYAGDLGSIPLYFTKPYLTFSKKVAEQYKARKKDNQITLVSEEHSKSLIIDPTESQPS